MDFQDEIKKYQARHNQKLEQKKFDESFQSDEVRRETPFQSRLKSSNKHSKGRSKMNPAFSLIRSKKPAVQVNSIVLILIMAKGCLGNGFWFFTHGIHLLLDLVRGGFYLYGAVTVTTSLVAIGATVAFFFNKKNAELVYLATLIVKLSFFFYMSTPAEFVMVPTVELLVLWVVYFNTRKSLKELEVT